MVQLWKHRYCAIFDEMSGTCDQKSARNGWVPFLLMKKRCTPLAFCGIKKSKGYWNYLNGTSWPRDWFFFATPGHFYLGGFQTGCIHWQEIMSSNAWTFLLSFLFLFGLGDPFTHPTYDFHVQMPNAPYVFPVQYLNWKNFIESLLCWLKLLPEQTPFLVIQSVHAPPFFFSLAAWSFQEIRPESLGFYDIFASSSSSLLAAAVN